MSQNEDLKAFDDLRTKLKELVKNNPRVFGELVRHVEQFNAVVKKIRDDLKAEARSTGAKIRAGEFEAIPRDRMAFALDAVQRLLPKEEWDALVQNDLLKVTISADGKGVAALVALETRYPGLAKLKGKETYKVDTPGPREIALGEIMVIVESMG